MKINNKGMTIVEIIVSLTLVSIVLVFLFNIMITVKNESAKSSSKSKLLINQALLIKSVESDFKDLKLIGVSTCNDDDISTISPKNGLTNSNLYCLKFKYNVSNADNLGYIFYYQYQYVTGDTGKLNVVGYKRGSNRMIRETDIEPNNATLIGNVNKVCDNTNTNCSITIYLPIKGDDGYDYGINLSYIYNTNDINFEYTPTSLTYGFQIN